MLRLEGFTEVTEILRSGVYALALRGTVIYVGKAKNLYSRIYTHRNLNGRARRGQRIPDWLPAKGFEFDQVFIRRCRLEDLDALEYEMINLYKPKFNRSLKNDLKVRAPVTIRTALGLELKLNPRPVIRRRLAADAS